VVVRNVGVKAGHYKTIWRGLLQEEYQVEMEVKKKAPVRRQSIDYTTQLLHKMMGLLQHCVLSVETILQNVL